ncbi:MAG: DNA cytosine methyltransferase [Coriobacteriaceae bacterium]
MFLKRQRMLGHDRGKTLEVICGRLTRLGMRFSMMSSTRAILTPQNRERLYIVAFRKLPRSLCVSKGVPTGKRIKDISSNSQLLPAIISPLSILKL